MPAGRCGLDGAAGSAKAVAVSRGAGIYGNARNDDGNDGRKWIYMELSEPQQAILETIVHRVSADLFVESATLDAQKTLELVLCREFVCYRPLHITQDRVDCTAALDGDPVAQQALITYLSSTLEGL